jgi:hypothetical protein
MHTFGFTHHSPYNPIREADHGTPIEFITDDSIVQRAREAVAAVKAKNAPREEKDDQVEAVESLKYDLAKAGLI